MIRININGCLPLIVLFIFMFLFIKFWYIPAFLIIVIFVFMFVQNIIRLCKKQAENYEPKIGETYKSCPECDKKLKVNATKCPNCGYKF